jgi:hypothetical protein
LTDAKQEHHILINIADFAVCLVTEEEYVAQRIRSRYHEFLGSTETPLITIELKIIPGAIFIEPEPGQFIIEASYEGDHLTYKSYLERGEVDLIEGRGYLEMSPQASVENLLRAVYAWFCIRNDALLLHSAGVIRDGDGYVFFGPSGAGKTTTSRLAARTALVVSDDLVIIRCDESGGTLYGVPFKGQVSDAPRANQKAPIKGIFRLRQDTSHYIEPLSPIKAVADLVWLPPRRSSLPNADWVTNLLNFASGWPRRCP